MCQILTHLVIDSKHSFQTFAVENEFLICLFGNYQNIITVDSNDNHLSYNKHRYEERIELCDLKKIYFTCIEYAHKETTLCVSYIVLEYTSCGKSN